MCEKQGKNLYSTLVKQDICVTVEVNVQYSHLTFGVKLRQKKNLRVTPIKKRSRRKILNWGTNPRRMEDQKGVQESDACDSCKGCRPGIRQLEHCNTSAEVWPWPLDDELARLKISPHCQQFTFSFFWGKTSCLRKYVSACLSDHLTTWGYECSSFTRIRGTVLRPVSEVDEWSPRFRCCLLLKRETARQRFDFCGAWNFCGRILTILRECAVDCDFTYFILQKDCGVDPKKHQVCMARKVATCTCLLQRFQSGCLTLLIAPTSTIHS